jgi:hypothetical protein
MLGYGLAAGPKESYPSKRTRPTGRAGGRSRLKIVAGIGGIHYSRIQRRATGSGPRALTWISEERRLHYAGKVGTGFDAGARTGGPLSKTGRETAADAHRNRLGGVNGSRSAGSTPSCARRSPTERTGTPHPLSLFQGLRDDKDANNVKRRHLPAKAAPRSRRRHHHASDRVFRKPAISQGDLPSITPRSRRFSFPALPVTSQPVALSVRHRRPVLLSAQLGKGLGPDVHSFEFRHKGNVTSTTSDEKGPLAVVQMGAIELHPRPH